MVFFALSWYYLSNINASKTKMKKKIIFLSSLSFVFSLSAYATGEMSPLVRTYGSFEITCVVAFYISFVLAVFSLLSLITLIIIYSLQDGEEKKKVKKPLFYFTVLFFVSLLFTGILLIYFRSQPVSGPSEQPECDLTGDGKCNDSDKEMFERVLNSCIGDKNFNQAADFNASDCIDLDDRHYLFD